MIDFTYNPIISADYKSRRRGLPYEASPSGSSFFTLYHLGSSVDLRKEVSAVGGDMTMRHGIILAKSIPAKKFHIKTGETIMEASIDEAFVDMTGTEGLWGEPVEAANRMRNHIRDTLGFTVNIGVAENVASAGQ